jgi:DNA-binding transcriptional regulator YdaS (Cro superfamily)
MVYFMDKTKSNQKKLAEELGVNHIHLNAVLNGRVKPSINLALEIEKASGGKYRAVDLRPDIQTILDRVK